MVSVDDVLGMCVEGGRNEGVKFFSFIQPTILLCALCVFLVNNAVLLRIPDSTSVMHVLCVVFTGNGGFSVSIIVLSSFIYWGV